MADEFTLDPPKYYEGACDPSDQHRFDTTVAAKISGHSRALKAVEDKVEKLEKVRVQVYAVVGFLIFVSGAFQWGLNMYIKNAISDELKPIQTTLEELKRRDEINKILIKPESLNDRIDALKGTVYSMDDRLRQLETKVKK